ncbi:MAG: chromate resistance protein [Actinomycetota bacterium]|nr:chromate resistance protein [Actinomycetota bacterium]
MRWITRSHLHLDRVATPWLIKRFVDPTAEFLFTDWESGVPDHDGTIPFGYPGIELSSPDERGTSFHKVLVSNGIDDPAVARMDRIIQAGVDHARGCEPSADLTDDEASLGAALDLLGSGLGLVLSDEEHLEAGLAIYEGVYALCQVMTLPATTRADAPSPLPERVPYLRRAIGRAAHLESTR